ncbi:MAG: phytanoyl-CoA dioxygenase family protein [Gammaproteobacteria bacterium]
MRPFRDSTEPGKNPASGRGKLRERMSRDGYLFFRGLLPRGDVAAVHRRIAAIALEAGWLSRQHGSIECVADPAGFCVDPEPEYLAVIERFNRVFEFQALSHHPALVNLIEELLGDEVLVHPKPLPRMIFPSRVAYTTPAHQDYPNIQGTTEVYTAWIPLMDCTSECGGLCLAEGSHTEGVFEFGIGNGAGGIEIIDPLTGRWAGGEFKAGDVLLFHSLTVHKGVPNVGKRLRMSVDARYQRVRDPFNPENADRPYGAPATWEELYAHWTDAQRARLAYYWERANLTFKPFDRTWFDRRDALGFELGEQGDSRARSVLLRIMMRDPDPEKRGRAKRLLPTLSKLEAP